jgi:hypothetical protein
MNRLGFQVCMRLLFSGLAVMILGAQWDEPDEREWPTGSYVTHE